LVGLTREASNGPSDVVTAVLRESINAVTCGSAQIFDETGGGGELDPGIGVEASIVGNGVCATVVSGDAVSVEIKGMVAVAKTSDVGVGTASVGAVQAVSMTVSTVNANKNSKRFFVLISLSSSVIISL